MTVLEKGLTDLTRTKEIIEKSLAAIFQSFSQNNIRPGNWMVSLWVESSWVLEFSVVVLGVQSSLSIFSNSDEVFNVLLVSEVGVQVIFEMLNKIHMLLDKVVSSNSWEGESTIIKFPGVDGNSWFLSFIKKLTIDFDGVAVSLFIE